MTEKEKKRLEMYEQRYAESWKKREINEEGTLKPFSKEELELTVSANRYHCSA